MSFLHSFTTHDWEWFIYTTSMVMTGGVVNMTLVYPPYCNSEDLCEDDEPVNAGMCRACSSPVCFGIISSRNFREDPAVN